MNSQTATPIFNLLSIGQRGVGKTVFLAGSYAELHPDSHNQRQPQLWFDCQDTQAQENIDSILSYIDQTGKYPPATMKVTNFCFSLKRRQLWHTRTLSYFRWMDIPGEICKVDNNDFRGLVSNSHGCCVFIDADALVHKHQYLQALEATVKQVLAIASLTHLHDRYYPFVIILTKCDLLDSSQLQQIQPIVRSLNARLDAVRANYQTFYSQIPLQRAFKTSNLRPIGAAIPLLQLVWDLSQPYHPTWQQDLHELIVNLQSNSFQLLGSWVVQALHISSRVTKQAINSTTTFVQAILATN